jgi:hypothetical protein
MLMITPQTLLTLAVTFTAAMGVASRALASGDNCSDAIAAYLGPNGGVSTASMTPSSNPPANEDCAFLAWSNSKDVWFRYDAPTAGTLALSFCGSNYDTSVVVYQGTCAALTRIGCDDDDCASATNYQSAIDALEVAAGPVYIRVGGYLGATGTVQFDLNFTPAAGIGTLFSIGYNVEGMSDPQPSLGYIKSIDAESYAFHSLAVRTDGTVFAWGRNTNWQCIVPSSLVDATKVAAGGYFSLALRSTGTVAYWGSTNVSFLPPAGLTNVTDIGAGESHGIALNLDGSVVCWGLNGYGQTTVPADVTACVDVDAGAYYSAAVRSNGTVASWGLAPAAPATAVTSALKVSAGGTFAGALRSGGTVTCWGNNFSGQCNVPAGLSGVTDIAAGYTHMLALKADGRVVAWGNSSYGQLILPEAAGPYARIAAGNGNSLAISRSDCNSNGLFDGLELSNTDCTGNDRPDCWDFAAGYAEDCNSNGVADVCEKQLYLAIGPTNFAPIGFGSPKTFIISSAIPAIGDVEMEIRARGDFSGDLEYITLSCGTLFERNILGGTSDCVEVGPITVTLTAEQFNDGIGADGKWRLDMIPSSAVNAALCPGTTYLTASVRYTAATSADCDLNGELDSCQIAAGTVADTNGNGLIDSCESAFDSCPTDLDGDAVTGASDLSALLGGWGGADPNIDIDGDGTVGASDLSALLGAWGPCPVN